MICRTHSVRAYLPAVTAESRRCRSTRCHQPVGRRGGSWGRFSSSTARDQHQRASSRATATLAMVGFLRRSMNFTHRWWSRRLPSSPRARAAAGACSQRSRMVLPSASTWSRPVLRRLSSQTLTSCSSTPLARSRARASISKISSATAVPKWVIPSWNLEPRLINQAIAAGASGYLSKVLTGPQIVCALERVMNGETIILTGDHETSVGGEGDWPGRSTGLSSREAEMLALITQGLSNEDVGRRAFLSKNSVKTYIRSAYRKIGVTSRTQAVLWAIDNGFKPDTLRTLDPALLVRPPRGSTRPAPTPEHSASGLLGPPTISTLIRMCLGRTVARECHCAPSQSTWRARVCAKRREMVAVSSVDPRRRHVWRPRLHHHPRLLRP